MYAAVRRTSIYLSARHVFLLVLLLSVVILLLRQLQCCRCLSSCAGWRNLLLWFIAPDEKVVCTVPLGSTVECTPRFTYNNPIVYS